jgi:drug/metabolite transporter (DMT)-like permease
MASTPLAIPSPSHQASSTTPRLGGLWAHSGLAIVPARRLIIVYILCVMVGYSFAMLVNSSAGRLLSPRFTSGTGAVGEDPLSGLGFVTHVADPVFLLSAFRAIAAVLLCSILVFIGDVPTTAPLFNDPGLKTAFIVGACNCLGYAPFLALTARGGVSLWSALIGLYVCGPVTYGVLVKGEARTKRKLVGVTICIIAGVLLGVSEEEAEVSSTKGSGSSRSGSSNSMGFQNFALYLSSIILWGICDGLGSYVGRDLHVLYVAGAGGAGFAAVALLFAVCGYALSAGTSDSGNVTPLPKTSGGLSASVALTLVAIAQCAGVGAWFASVKLGVLSECSSFLPITSLYTIVASGAALLIFQEKPPPLYFVGTPLAAIGILCIAFGSSSGGGGNGEGANDGREIGTHKRLEEEVEGRGERTSITATAAAAATAQSVEDPTDDGW